MRVPAIRIKKIYQIDSDSFEITWSDDKVKRYFLKDIQSRCPCAQCVDEMTGIRAAKGGHQKEAVRARRITSVGRYGLRIQFASGCSTGIYSYDFLHSLEV